MRRIVESLASAILIVSLSGCLGTIVRSPTREGSEHRTTRAHILAAPTQIDARHCRTGLSQTFTFVPLWGVAVGILTLGILVPMTTVYSCTPSGG
jgi:hypothetical protein